MLLGSEGTLGVITEAWVRVRPEAAHARRPRVRFADFAAGARGRARARAVGAAPGELPADRRARGGADVRRRRLARAARARLRVGRPSGRRADGGGAGAAAREHGGDWEERAEGARGGAVGAWREAFLRAPVPARHVRRDGRALGDVRDGDHVGPLRRLPRGGDGGRRARRCARPAAEAIVTCRFTHAYPDGAAPYFTVLAPARRGEELEQWDAIKRAAGDAILAAGGTITHHHAVGRDHRPGTTPSDPSRSPPRCAAPRPPSTRPGCSTPAC